jgi:hypothetical protein
MVDAACTIELRPRTSMGSLPMVFNIFPLAWFLIVCPHTCTREGVLNAGMDDRGLAESVFDRR